MRGGVRKSNGRRRTDLVLVRAVRRRPSLGRPHLTHVALWTADIERSIAFYRELCELVIVHDRGEDGGRVVWVGERKERPRFVIVLIARPFERREASSFAHFGFSCRTRAEVDRRAALARSRGVLELEPRDGGPVVGYFCILRDPDGNAVEFSHGQTIDPGFFRKRGAGGRRPVARGRRPGRVS
jgi:catechol 2,3-dioxygenase-like lactoylglutathione lyase family enzyme